MGSDGNVPDSGAGAVVLKYVVPSAGTLVALLVFLSPIFAVRRLRRRMRHGCASVARDEEDGEQEEEQEREESERPSGGGGVHRDVASGASSGADTAVADAPPTNAAIVAATRDVYSDSRGAVDASERRVLGPLNPLPYPLMLANTLAWCSYAFTQGDYFIFWSNAPGTLITLFHTVTAYGAVWLDEYHQGWKERAVAHEVRARRSAKLRRILHCCSCGGGDGGEDDGEADGGECHRFDARRAWPFIRRRPSRRVASNDEEKADEAAAATTTAGSQRRSGAAALPATASRTGAQRSRLPSRSTLRTQFEWIMFTLAAALLLTSFFVYIVLAPGGPLAAAHAQRLVAGVTANVILGGMYASPLFVAVQVVRGRDASAIDLPLAVMCFVNGVLWTTYGIAIADPLVYALNAFGAVLAAVQLVLIGVLGRRRLRDMQS